MSASQMTFDISKPRIWPDGRRAYGKWNGPGWISARLMPGGHVESIRPAVFRSLPVIKSTRKTLPIIFKHDLRGVGTVHGLEFKDRFEIWVNGEAVWTRTKLATR